MLGAGPAAAQPAADAARADAIRFDILEFVIEGNSVLPQASVERAVTPFLGRGRRVEDAESARKALEKAYQDAGFLSVVVNLPPQRVGQAGGAVRLAVVEATIDRLRVTGAQYHRPTLIKGQLPSVAPGAVPNFNDMQAELSQLSRQSADREITPLVAAGTQPNTLDVELKVQDRLPVNGFAELNTKQSKDTERGRFEASVSYDNLFQAQHSLGLYWLVAPRNTEDANILSLTYRAPLAEPGDSVSLAWNRSDSNAATALGGSTVTRGTTIGLRWRDELRPVTRYQHAMTWSATYRDLADRNVDIAGFQTGATPLRYWAFGANYDLNRVGDTAGRLSTLQASLNFGLTTLNRRQVDCDGRTVDQFECKRAGALPGFQVVNISTSHREPLGGQWTGQVRLQGQFSTGPLVPSEQITLGGADSVHGYFDGEQAADFAVLLRTEIGTPRLLEAAGAELRGEFYYDRAALLRKDPLPGEIGRSRMGGVGFGLRVDTNFGLLARLDWARVLVEPAGGGAVDRGSRLDMTLRQSF